MLELREVNREDIPVINLWRNDKGLIDFLGAPFRYIGPEIDDAWFDAYLKNRNNTVRCAIIDDKDPKAILGLVSLTGIDWVHRCATLHIMIGVDSNRNQGVGTFAINAILLHAFQNLGLHRIELDALASNERAIHVYEKCGFIKEGIRRGAAYKNGAYHDLIAMGLLREEWLPLEEKAGGILKVTDASAVRALWCAIRDSYGPPLFQDIRDFDGWMIKVGQFAITYERVLAGRVLGAVSFYANDLERRIAFITIIGVFYNAQGRGAGSDLLEKTFTESRRKGMQTVRLEVRKGNARAQSLYERKGFVRYGENDLSWLMERRL